MSSHLFFMVTNMSIKKLCQCGKVIDIGMKRCEDCARKAEQARKEYFKQYDAAVRDKRTAVFYNSPEWEKARQQALMRDFGLCRDCLEEKKITPADVVDHVKPIKKFWHLRLMLSNLRSLCNMHHAVKSAEDRRKYGA